MLRGAVTFGEDFEQTYMKRIFDLDKGMTQAISHFSRHQDAKAVLENGRFRYAGADQQNAEKKIRSFYAVTIWALVAVAAGLLLITNLAVERSEEHTTELQSLMSTSYAVFCLKKKHTSASTETTLHRHHMR